MIVDIAGTTISSASRLNRARADDRAEAHAIVETMRTEAQDSYLGFRLVFILTNNDWDSG